MTPRKPPATAQRNAEIARAVRLLRAGKLVAMPTETVYGLAADARNDDAVAQIFALKRRPPDHPLIVHVAGADQLDAWARDVPESARLLAQTFWPGPLTLVLRKQPDVSARVTAGQDTVALRVPDHPLALALLRRFRGGVAAPSANPFGAVSPTSAADVRAYFDEAQVPLVLDGGRCGVGIESTIVDLSSGTPAILRPGGITREALEAVLQQPMARPTRTSARAPGQHPQHYAPNARVVLCEARTLRRRVTAALRAGRTVGVLLPRGVELPPHPALRAVALPATDSAYARALYRHLRAFDRARCDVVFATLPEAHGIGSAIADRLRRAAGVGAPRLR